MQMFNASMMIGFANVMERVESGWLLHLDLRYILCPTKGQLETLIRGPVQNCWIQ